MKKILLLILIILILLGYLVYDYFKENTLNLNVCSMDVKLCPDGSYVKRVPPLCKFEKCPDISIRVYNISREEKISSPLTIEGIARGNWFFEGNFPIILTNWDGLIIAESYAIAQDNWMTEDLVYFQATIEFEKHELYDKGSLIFQKANPSELPENDEVFEIPIVFK